MFDNFTLVFILHLFVSVQIDPTTKGSPSNIVHLLRRYDSDINKISIEFSAKKVEFTLC